MKAINDRFGHPAGDLVIRQIAEVLTKVLRDNDTAVRLGGEEFALLLASVDGGKAAAAVVAWLDWQLRGDARAGRTFVGKECGLCRDPAWQFSASAGR